MDAGDVLFFNGALVHGSYPNTTADRFRRALIGHYIEGAAAQVAEFYHPALRMDGTPLGAPALAAGKAYTAVLWGMRTGEFMESTQPGGADWSYPSTNPRVVVYAGGLPLYRDGQLVGGIGASGGTAEQDEACVGAAANAAGYEVEA